MAVSAPAPGTAEIGAGCRACGKDFAFVLFPAAARPPSPPPPPGPPLAESGATCFHHPAKPAIRACDDCGAFLCDLCDLDLGEAHLCPRCFDADRAKGRLKKIETSHILYDGIALGCALAPFTLVLYFVAPFSAPAALFLGIKSLRQKPGPIPRSRAMGVTAIVLGSLELVFAVAFVGLIIYAVIHNLQHPRHPKPLAQ